MINIFNSFIGLLGVVLSAILSVFPTSPFTLINNSPIAAYLGNINYFIPINNMITIAEAWLICIGIFYIYQAALRWLKIGGE